MELIVKAIIEDELNQDICFKYWKDEKTGEVSCGVYK